MAAAVTGVLRELPVALEGRSEQRKQTECLKWHGAERQQLEGVADHCSEPLPHCHAGGCHTLAKAPVGHNTLTQSSHDMMGKHSGGNTVSA